MDIRLKITKKERAYNAARDSFMKNVGDYYRQGAYAERVSEDDLIDSLRELKSMREEIVKMRKEAIDKTHQSRLAPKFNP